MIGSSSKELPDEDSVTQPLTIERKIRLITITQVGFALALCFFMYRAVMWDITPRFISLCLVSALLAASVLAKLQKDIRLAADLIVVGVTMASIVAICTSGGLVSTVGGWLLICPCLAGLLNGRESCQKWGCIVFFAMFCLLSAELSGYQWPNLTPEAYQTNQAHTHMLAQMLSMLLILFAFTHEFELYEEYHEMKLLHMHKSYSETQRNVRQAEKTSFAKTRFLMNKNRELRTPVSNIIGFSKRLNHRCKELNVQDRRSLDAIYRHSKELLKAVDEIAEFVNLEETTIQLCWQSFNLSEVIAALPKRLGREPSESNIEISLQHGKGFHMLGDPARIGQAMSQLLEYCLEITYKNTVQLKLEVDTQIEELAHVTIDIPHSNIANDNIDNLFTIDGLKLEANLDNTRNGLGLAIASRLIEMHEGSLTAEATPQNGLRFHIILPPYPPSQDIRATAQKT
ncbi:MAG: HAMP domain-containing histidine kinase [Cellvibrionaceae bacterium]|nr:HAMP domain-containing histidine kinase [Cellvibrionaceae bacterium]